MVVFVLDDERYILEDEKEVIARVSPMAEIRTFTRALPSLRMIQEEGIYPDIVFCDIEMPGLSGLNYALKLKSLSPDTRIVFVTAYPQYAVDAFKVRAQGYVLKPLRDAQVREEMSFLPDADTVEEIPGRLQVKCFGYFEVTWQGRPLVFTRNKTLELLAYLVDREGGWCTTGEIVSDLWEDGSEERKDYLRVLTSDLRQVLRSIGMEGVLLKKRAQLAVDKDLLDCDYYKMLQGDMAAVNAFHGEYMVQYSWAEQTVARLFKEE